MGASASAISAILENDVNGQMVRVNGDEYSHDLCYTQN